MKILFLIPSYKPAYVYGGTIVVIAMLAEKLVTEGHDVSVYTTAANGSEELDVNYGVETNVDGVKVTYFKRITGDHTHISPSLWKNLYQNVNKFDVVHIHSWWNPLIIGAALICKLKGVKPIFSPHGMLSSYIIETNNAGKKKFIHTLLGKHLLKNSFLHVTAKSELEEALKIIPSWQGVVIPNLVLLSDVNYPRHQNDVFTIGFMSRVDPKKGLDLLITALSKVNFKYKLVIAGDGDPLYVNSIKNLSAELKVNENLEWVGWKKGEEKFEFLSKLDLFALTSHNENFAIVVIEALSVGTPVLVSKNVGTYQYVSDKDLGWVSDLTIENIVHQLNELYIEHQKQQAIKTNAKGIIDHDFNGSNIATQYIDFYKSTLS